MGKVALLSLANAGSLAVQLLAVVLVILTRPRPKPLLWAFWISAMVVSFATSWVVLSIFRAKGTILGSTSTRVSPVAYLVIGCVALAAAAFAASRSGRELIGHELDKRLEDAHEPDPEGSLGDRVRVKVVEVRSKAEDALNHGSVWVALAVGFFFGTPTPYSLAAIGVMVRSGYTLPVQLLLILGFGLVTYVVVEIPLASYVLSPRSTEARVRRFSEWLGTHKIQGVAAAAGVVGALLVVKGLTAL